MKPVDSVNPMPGRASTPALRWFFGLVGVLLVSYLAAAALKPSIVDLLPRWLAWFGRPGSVATIALSTMVLVAVCTVMTRSDSSRRLVGVSFTVIALLITVSAVLGLSSYWQCHDATHPALFTPLMATAQLVKGGISDYSLSGRICPYPTPAGLEIARLAALSAIFTGLVSVVAGVFHIQADRLRANLAESVTVILGLSEDSQPVISRIAQTLDRRSTLVVITSADDTRVHQVRRRGARVVLADFNTPSSVVSLRLWRNLERLHLMGPDPAINLLWLDRVGARLTEIGHRQRVPLTVRIDDPWLAEAWRAQQFGGSDERWAADVVGKYRATATRIVGRLQEIGGIERVFLCGTSQLTLAVCADMSRNAVERAFYRPPGSAALPALTLVGGDADQYLQDHELHWKNTGLTTPGPEVDAVVGPPTIATMQGLLDGVDPTATAVVLIDTDSAMASRLAARFPGIVIFAPDVNTASADDTIQIAGKLQSYSLVLGIDDSDDRVQDAWERAAVLIHERYVSTISAQTPRSAAAVPWAELSEFYRGSNRRVVRNTLWMVERIAGHTWNTWGNAVGKPLTGNDIDGAAPLEQLALMGFGADVALEMAEAEHEDWCRYYTQHGWKYGATRDDARRVHDKLVTWSQVAGDPQLRDTSLRSLAATLWSLQQLGYRSQPLWRVFTRVGVVTAVRKSASFRWTSDSGHVMTAKAGDWAVSDGDTMWSVRDDIFRASYDEIAGRQFRRKGRVHARPARAGEVVDTLEGMTAAGEGDWIVRGSSGEQWPVNAAEFAQRYAELSHREC